MKEFRKLVESMSQAAEAKQEWMGTIDSELEKARPSQYTVAIVGRTGFVRLCLSPYLVILLPTADPLAVLREPALRSSRKFLTKSSCSQDIEGTEAVIEFIDREQWKDTLIRLIGDAYAIIFFDRAFALIYFAELTTVLISKNSTRAREKLLGCSLRGLNVKSWNVEELLVDLTVNEYLDRKAITVTSSNVSNFQKQIEQFVASALSTARVFWPLVKRVSIMGKFEVLSTGITLVDLPGHGDVDNARDSMANEYLRTADSVFLVAGITRAKDDSVSELPINSVYTDSFPFLLQDIQSRLNKQLRHLIMDGRMHEQSIALVLTATDGVIGSNECTLPGPEQKVVDNLTEEALALGQEIRDLKIKKERKEKSKSKKKEETLKQYEQKASKRFHIMVLVLTIEKIQEKKSKMEIKNGERNLLLAQGRNRIVAAALQCKYESLFRDQAGPDEKIPPVPIFCLGSRDYLCLAGLDSNQPTTFSDKEDSQTGIPRLRQFIQNDGERRNLANAAAIVAKFCRVLSQASQLNANSTGDTIMNLRIDEILDKLDSRCTEMCQQLIPKLRAGYEEIEHTLGTAVHEAERASPGIFAIRAKNMKWNQYKAMMRMDGLYSIPGGQPENRSLNSDLTSSILPAVMQAWTVGVNVENPKHLKQFYQVVLLLLRRTIGSYLTQKIRDEFADAVKLICQTNTSHKAANLLRSLGLDAFVTDLKVQNDSAAAGAARIGSRTWDSEVKERLLPQYAKASAEKGPGMFKRMKGNKLFIEANAGMVFGDIGPKVHCSFMESVKAIEELIATKLARLTKQLRISCLGSDSKSSTLKALSAQGEAVKKFGVDYEDKTIAVLDMLKKRLQEIERIS
ncbi:hypothetical protein DFH07DRAFT_773520 [Mycena maculata]|uniref:Uncharacterized protein n=1 Tax=Mycena maculata TaxID=230809 RepID=A0AAD7ND92_9AGAR|nr:hypothetical protein DFH07DRAFT_773520 [Mycena maculata]